MKKTLLVALFGLMACLPAFAYYGQPTLNISMEGGDDGQLMLRGSGLCDSDTFKVRVIDSVTGDAGWYQSRRGNTEWPIVRNRDGDCRITMQLSKRVLVPGYLLQAVTLRGGYRMHSVTKAIPCVLTEIATVMVGDFVFDAVVETPLDCRDDRYPNPQPQPQPQPQQYCSSQVVVEPNDRSAVGVNVSCSLAPEYLSVRMLDSVGNVLCGNVSFQASPYPARACTTRLRNPGKKLDYRVELMTSQRLFFNDQGTIKKDPSWNFMPEAAYTTPLNMAPASQQKALGRGQYWDVRIGATVTDGDVDYSEHQSLIKVELVDMASGKVLRNSMANTGETVNFDLEHQYITPKLFGKPHEQGDLNRGNNQLLIRVWDAYNGSAHIDLPVVNVTIN